MFFSIHLTRLSERQVIEFIEFSRGRFRLSPWDPSTQKIPMMEHQMERTWKTKWKLGLYGDCIGIQVYKLYLHWALKSVNITYIGLFGSLGFTQWFNRPFRNLNIQAVIYYSFIHSFLNLLIPPCIHVIIHASFIQSFICSFTHSFIHSLIHSFIHSLILPFIPSFINSLIFR